VVVVVAETTLVELVVLAVVEMARQTVVVQGLVA
jgi:hypothetical protein